MGSFEVSSVFCKLQFTPDINTWQNCFLLVSIHHLSHFWKKWANCNKSRKTRSGSWSPKTFLHEGKCKQGPCSQVVPAKQGVLHDAQADSVGLGWAEGGLSTAEPLAEARGQQGQHGLVAPAGAQHQWAGRHLLGVRQGWLPSACKCCKDWQSSDHGLLKIIEKSVRALTCQELLLCVCPALTLFPTPGTTFLTSEYKYWLRQKLF